jgi:hypothetical protein
MHACTALSPTQHSPRFKVHDNERTAYGQTMHPSRGNYSFGTSIGNTVRIYCRVIRLPFVRSRQGIIAVLFFLYVQFLAPICCITGSRLNSKLLFSLNVTFMLRLHLNNVDLGEGSLMQTKILVY